MDVAFKAIGEYGVTTVALVAVSLFAWWLVRTGLQDLRASRDRAIDISERQVAATEELTRIVHEALDELSRERRR